MGCKGSKSATAAPVIYAESQTAPQAPPVAKATSKKQADGQLPTGTEVLFVLGGPGSGKGTQCDRIVAKYGLKHLSAGDLLRDEVKSKSELGVELEAIMKEGKLVPQETTIALLRKAMISSGRNKFLVDGFPRALDQARTFEQTVCLPRLVLFFDCPLETMEERLLSRGKTSGRSDDNVETIKKRFKTFQEQSMPVVEYYETQAKVKRISAVPPPDEVFVEVEKALDELQAQYGSAPAAAADAKSKNAETKQTEAASAATAAQSTETASSTVIADSRMSGTNTAVTSSNTTTEANESRPPVKQKPSFKGIEDPELAAKIEAATGTAILGTSQGRLEDSDAKPLDPSQEVLIKGSKMSSDGSKMVVELPADATTSVALPAPA